MVWFTFGNTNRRTRSPPNPVCSTASAAPDEGQHAAHRDQQPQAHPLQQARGGRQKASPIET